MARIILIVAALVLVAHGLVHQRGAQCLTGDVAARMFHTVKIERFGK